MTENVKVFVRGIEGIDWCDVDSINNKITLSNPDKKDDRKTFVVDGILTKELIYEETSKPLIDSAFDGYNATIITFNDTDTLKMQIHQAFDHIFNFIKSEPPQKRFLIQYSVFQIDGEYAFDMLSKTPTRPLTVKMELKTKRYFVKDVLSFVVKRRDQLSKLMKKCQKSEHHLVHQVIFETISQKPKGEDQVRSGRILFVNLAISRKNDISEFDRELFWFEKYVECLALGRHKCDYIMLLTKILSDSLAGNSKTIMISSCTDNYLGTLSMMDFVSNVRKIKNTPVINSVKEITLIQKFTEEIEKLRAKIRSYESQIRTGGKCSSE